MSELSKDLQVALKQIIDEFEKDEKAVRERQIRQWKKLEYYWSGFTRLYWDDVAHDWRIFDDGYGYETSGQGYYDKPVNVFRAYLESIIAALSATVPAIKCIPDDADNPSDILTAKGGTKIAELVYKHIDAPLLWCKALFVYCTQGMVAAYNYTVTDDSYGTVDQGKYEDIEETKTYKACPNCGIELDDQNLQASIDLMLTELNQFDPGDSSAPIDDLYSQGQVVCPSCAVQMNPELKTEKVIVTRLVGTSKQAKSRQCIEVNGGLFIKVPNWARCQKDIPYLSYCYETHYTNVYKKWPLLRKKMDNLGSNINSSDGNELYERWGRLSPQYYGEYPRATPTVRNWWLRPAAFEVINDEETRKALIKKFPDGCKCVWINDEYVESCNENLDDHWTLTYNPLSEYIHFDPLGLLLTSVQEITQDLLSLTLQTIEHGVGQTFADPSVINFDQYRNTEILPGGLYPAKPKSGKGLADGFFEMRTASLSAEVMPFGEQVQSLGQFVSGALPSLFGGEQAGSSRTAAQYSMSRNQALQRLQTTWKMINYWWGDIFGKVIPAYIKCMLDDERVVKQQSDNTFVNVMIRKSEMDGKLGDIEIESSDQLPSTWGQVKDTVMEMIQLNNPAILEALGSPENLGVLQDAIGLSQFDMPGESDRDKQYEEIQLLLQSAAIQQPPDPMNPAASQSQEMPSIMPEFEVDNHKVEGDICRYWLVGEAGRQAKVNNPDGYHNVLLHLKMHIMMLQQLMNPQPQPGPPQPQPQGDQGPQSKLRPLPGNPNGGQQPTVQ